MIADDYLTKPFEESELLSAIDGRLNRFANLLPTYTLKDSGLVYIPSADFQQLLLANPEVSSQFIKLLAGHVADREQQLLNMAYHSIRRRVADALLRLNEQEKGLIQLSRDNLAALAGTATETLIRTLSEFKQDGLIEMIAAGGIRVLQPGKLRRSNW